MLGDTAREKVVNDSRKRTNSVPGGQVDKGKEVAAASFHVG